MTTVTGSVLAAAVNAAFDPMVIINRSGVILFASERIADASGRTAEQVVGKSLSIFLPPRLYGVLDRFLSEFFTAPAPRLIGWAQPLYFLHPDGSERRIEFGINALSIDGEPAAVCTLRDAADRPAPDDAYKHAIARLETRLSNTLQELRILIEHAPAAIAVLDRDLRYVLASRRWLQDFGIEGDIAGRRHYDIFPKLEEKWKHAYARCLAGETLGSDDDTVVRGDGRIEYARWQLIPWRNVENQIGGITIFSEVITQRKLAELALREHSERLETAVRERTAQLEQARDEALRASAAKTRFIAGVSHDLRQPLHAASLLLEGLERRVGPDLSELCAKAETAILDVSDKLTGLLDVSRLEEGVLQPRIDSFPLAPLLERAIRHHRPAAEAKGLRIQLAGCATTALTDKLLFARIIDNFLSNAVKYTRRGEINVSCAVEDDSVRVSVADTGIGIEEAALARIFEPYVQADGNDGRAQGYGLGLAICRTVADALHCTLEVQSELGRGSVFSVRLPLAQASADVAPEQSARLAS